MYILEANFSGMSNFISGYLLGVDTTLSLNLNAEFSEWLNSKGKQTSLFWTAYIKVILANQDDALAYQLLFEKLKEFLGEKLIAGNRRI